MDTSPTGCVHHDGAVASNGYGAAWYKGKYIGAHRKAYIQHHSIAVEAIAGQVVRHTCDNRLCVNPMHLVIGSHADNSQDMVDRRRQGIPPVLTLDQAREIRARYVPGSRGRPNPNSQSAMAREYKVTQSVIRQIVLNITYKETL